MKTSFCGPYEMALGAGETMDGITIAGAAWSKITKN